MPSYPALGLDAAGVKPRRGFSTDRCESCGESLRLVAAPGGVVCRACGWVLVPFTGR